MVLPVELNWLSLAEKEAFCSLTLTGAAKDWQRDIAANLHNIYLNGRDTIASDRHKAAKYAKIAELNPIPSGSAHLNTENTYNAFVWFTSWRLFGVRMNRMLSYKKWHFLRTTLLQRTFSALGLSYGLELLVESGIILKNTFFPRTDTEKRLSAFRRFKNAFQKGDRPNRMANAAVWFAINFTGFMLPIIFTGGAALPVIALVVPLMNLIGLTFDLSLDSAKSYQVVTDHTNLMAKVRRAMANDHGADARKTHGLREVESQLGHKTKSVLFNRSYIVFTSLLVGVGMGLLFFPPTTILGAAIMGAGIALVAGSLLGGLGKRVFFNKIVEKVTSILQPQPIPLPPVAPVPESQPVLDKGLADEAPRAAAGNTSAIKKRLSGSSSPSTTTIIHGDRRPVISTTPSSVPEGENVFARGLEGLEKPFSPSPSIPIPGRFGEPRRNSLPTLSSTGYARLNDKSSSYEVDSPALAVGRSP